MAVKWTKEQQSVIDLRDRNILVSAAAGSGKTAVLVERIISRLTTDDPPLDVDRLLVVTFTEAAAAEMKERIAAAIEKKLDEDPDQAHLRKQSALIHSAKITTIHSFCLSVIRDYFHTIDLDPGFRIAEEGELKLLRQDVLQELLEDKYQEAKEEFLLFVETFATGKDDRELEEMIDRLYEFSGSYPDPDEWLDECVLSYEKALEEDSEFGKAIYRYTRLCLDGVMQDIETAKDLCMEDGGPEPYLETIEADEEILSILYDAKDFADLAEKMEKMGAWPKLKSCRSKDHDEILIKSVKDLREGWKKQITSIKEMFFFQSYEEMKKDMELCVPVVRVLIDLVKEFQEKYARKKAEKNIIDFRDMEHFALKILTRKTENGLEPTEVAKEYQEQFEEVMIDEYQDSNLIQEAILTSVSRMSSGRNNLFMVGDVKQSIYRFRLSRPELFMEKFDTYSLTDGPCQRIDLHKNFRSRSQVLDSTNAVFERIMTKNLGKITYDSAAALNVGASYPESNECDTEVLILEAEDEGGKIASDDARRMEALMVAKRIKEMKNMKIWDAKKEEYRKISYGDIVILSRSLSGWADVFSKVLNQEGIPAFASSREGYFSTLEIGWIMDYLRILDNYRQDIPLAAMLKSPFGQLSDEEMARIRNSSPDQQFHEAVLNLVDKEETSDELSGKLKKIFEELEFFRKKVPYTSIHDLLVEIIEKTNYRNYILAMPGGEQRAANLDMLLVRAKAFENTSYKGLFHFVRYMDQLKKYDVDFGEAGIYDEQTDAVRIMSIHKSKGLEFPVVFVVGCGKNFNMRDTNHAVVIHPDLGVGIDAIDLQRRTKAPTIVKKVVQLETSMENLGEELRVLYVAMTRAKEKLIMTGTMSSLEKKMESYETKSRSCPLAFTTLSNARTYFDWLIPSVLGIGARAPIGITVEDLSSIVRAQIQEEVKDQFKKRDFLEKISDVKNKEAVTDESYRSRIEGQLAFDYPYKTDDRLKMKYSVSELKKQAMIEEVPESEEMIVEEEVIPLVPKFLQQTEELSGASRGTAYHKVMEILDFDEEYTLDLVKEKMQGFKEEGYLDEEMHRSVRPGDVFHFLTTDAGERMHRASLKKQLYKEQPFVFGMDAKELYPDMDTDETVLIQGIIDVYFEEEDGLVVLDYKTDKVSSPNELVLRYKEQLNLYARALEQGTGKKVKEKIIYSFTLNKQITL